MNVRYIIFLITAIFFWSTDVLIADIMNLSQKDSLKNIKNMIIKVDYVSGIDGGRVLIKEFYFK